MVKGIPVERELRDVGLMMLNVIGSGPQTLNEDDLKNLTRLLFRAADEITQLKEKDQTNGLQE